jgi:hypothetical protein
MIRPAVRAADHVRFKDLVEAEVDHVVIDSAGRQLLNVATCLIGDDRHMIVVSSKVQQTFGPPSFCQRIERQHNLLDFIAQAIGRSGARDLSAVEDGHGVGDRFDLAQQVRAVKDRAARSLEVLNQIAIEFLACDGGMRIIVVFPAPLRPKSASVCPAGMLSETFCSTCCDP